MRISDSEGIGGEYFLARKGQRGNIEVQKRPEGKVLRPREKEGETSRHTQKKGIGGDGPQIQRKRQKRPHTQWGRK